MSAGAHAPGGGPAVKLFLRGADGQATAVSYPGAPKAKDVVAWALGQVRRAALARLGVTTDGAPGARLAAIALVRSAA